MCVWSVTVAVCVRVSETVCGECVCFSVQVVWCRECVECMCVCM